MALASGLIDLPASTQPIEEVRGSSWHHCEIRATPAMPVLLVTAAQEEFMSVKRIFEDEEEWRSYIKRPLTLLRSRSLEGAKSCLRKRHIPVLVFDGDTSGDRWQDLAAYLARRASPPALILASRLADEQLWAEAMNLGVYDLLAKPFEKEQVIRTVGLAWLHWRDRENLNSRAKWRLEGGAHFAAGS